MALKQFVPQGYCLRCDVCCRFSESHTIWAPKFTRCEVMVVVENHMLPPDLFSQSSRSLQENSTCPVNLIEYKQGFRCPCFTPESSKCLIYNQRPFECQLYPFVLLKKEGKLFIALDRKCPYCKTNDSSALQSYKEYLKQEFAKEEYVSFFDQHRDLFSEYELDGLDIVLPVFGD